MSYGWLTESSLGPKKPKEISVPKSSINSLNSIIQRHIQKDNEKHEKKKKVKKVDLFELSNPGVELRNKIDRRESTLNKRNRKNIMEQKAKLYEQLKEGKVEVGDDSEYLVDFKRKKQNEKEEKDEENLDEGKPAIWHRNTLSLINENKFDNLKKSTPTQIVYPNTSFNIGLPVDSRNLQESTISNNDDSIYDENGNEKPLIVYASNRAENVKNFVKHFPLICLMLFYLLSVLYFGHLMKSHPDYTRSSVVYLKLTKVTLFLYLVVLTLLGFGYSQILRFNSIFTTVLTALGLFYIENIYSVMMSFVQLVVLIFNYHSIYKNTPKVFMVSSIH